MDLLPKNGVYSVDELIQYYHHVCPRLKYHEIQRIINEYHNMEMSLSTLKRRLRELGLNRGRGNIINDQMLDDIVQNELATSLCLV